MSTDPGDSRVSQSKRCWTCSPQFREGSSLCWRICMERIHPQHKTHRERESSSLWLSRSLLWEDHRLVPYPVMGLLSFFQWQLYDMLHQNCYWYGILVVSPWGHTLCFGQAEESPCNFFPVTYCNWPLVHDDGYTKCVLLWGTLRGKRNGGLLKSLFVVEEFTQCHAYFHRSNTGWFTYNYRVCQRDIGKL